MTLAFVAGEVCAGPPPTDADITQARERFSEARRLEDAGRWSEALTLLQRVAEVRTTPQVRFHIALCMENVGLWTQALDGYAQAASEAGNAAPEVVKEAGEHIHKLEQTLPTVSVHVEGAAAGDELLLDRRRIPLDDRPLAMRTDPGPHTAEVRRGGAIMAREFFALEAKSTRRIELRIGSVAPDPAEPTGPGPAPTTAPTASVAPTAPPVPTAAPAAASPGSTQRILGWTALGAGVTSLVLGGVFIGLRAGALSRIDTACPSYTGCPTSIEPTVSDGKTDAALVNVFAVVGGVAAAAGLAILLTAPPSPAPPNKAAAPAAAAWLGVGRGGLSMGGVF